MTFQELYKQALEAPTPRQAFIRRVMDATGCSYAAARAWSEGRRTPSLKAKEAVSRAFGVRAEELFPGKG